MNMNKELASEAARVQKLTAILASAYTLLALAPCDSWGHEGTPAEMAAFVVEDLKKQGRLSMLYDVFLSSSRDYV